MADWSNYPMNPDVNWPKDEKTVGILGVAPIATADFYTKLVSRPMKKDWLYPRILMDTNPKIPSRGRYFDLNETDPVPYIQNSIVELAEYGADFVVIPCNTAHVLYDRFAGGINIPVPHIIDITAKRVANGLFTSPMVLCSRAVREYRIYEDSFARFGLKIQHFPDQLLISEGIESVKQNLDSNKISMRISEIISSFSNIDAVIYGCTEIDLLMNTAGRSLKYPVVDSNQALADFCIEFVKKPDIDERIRMFG